MTRIRIKNRDHAGLRLSQTKVFIGDQLCGQLPVTTEHTKWYEVTCNSSGNEVKLVTVHNTY